jgi:hypothetical protein
MSRFGKRVNRLAGFAGIPFSSLRRFMHDDGLNIGESAVRVGKRFQCNEVGRAALPLTGETTYPEQYFPG